MAISFVRTVIIFFSLLFSMRIMGKRQLGELEPMELVVAVLISNLASQPLSDTGSPLIYGLVPVLTLLSCQLLISYATVRSVKFRRIICGKPSILIEGGNIVQSEMEKNRITLDELYSELRALQITDISTVSRAVLETNGSLSVVLFAGENPITPNELGVQVPENGSPIIVINNGRVLSDNLKIMGLNEKWLLKQLKQRNVKDASAVYLMTVDRSMEINFVLKENSK